MYCRLAPSLKEACYLLRQTLIVLIFQFVYTLATTFQLGVRLYTGLSGHHIDSENSYSLWLTFSLIVSPIRELLFPIGYLVCFYPVKAMVVDTFWKCCFKLKNSSYIGIENPDITRPRHATVPESTRISQPSSTFFIASHPDDYSASETSHCAPEWIVTEEPQNSFNCDHLCICNNVKILQRLKDVYSMHITYQVENS